MSLLTPAILCERVLPPPEVHPTCLLPVFQLAKPSDSPHPPWSPGLHCLAEHDRISHQGCHTLTPMRAYFLWGARHRGHYIGSDAQTRPREGWLGMPTSWAAHTAVPRQTAQPQRASWRQPCHSCPFLSFLSASERGCMLPGESRKPFSLPPSSSTVSLLAPAGFPSLLSLCHFHSAPRPMAFLSVPAPFAHGSRVLQHPGPSSMCLQMPKSSHLFHFLLVLVGSNTKLQGGALRCTPHGQPARTHTGVRVS